MTVVHSRRMRRSRKGVAVLIAGAAALTACTATSEDAPGEASEESSATADQFELGEATIAEMRAALESGAMTSVELTTLYLNRIHAYDANGIRLNSTPIMSPDVLADAQASDDRRAAGEPLGPLDGIPYSIKDSFKAAGLTVASGSPAFENLTANDDAFAVEKLREQGAVLIGKTNMPPMAAGGMQDGVYGRAESPYNGDYLTAAWFSGSSNGSGTATAANFAAFAMGEETVSSGRSPASNNALVAYTPSRGLISIRGNWPLFPVRDVVVPYTRTVQDMLELLNVLVVEDPDTSNDFWRDQSAVQLPAIDDVRPDDYADLADPDALDGLRIGVPKMYINQDLGGTRPVATRPSIIELWKESEAALEELGAEVVEVDFPVQNNQDGDRVGAVSPVERGLMPAEFGALEFGLVNAYAAENFLQAVGDPNYPSWTEVDSALVFPNPPGTVADKQGRSYASYMDSYGETVADGVPSWDEVDGLGEALQGLEDTRKADFEDWLEQENLDAIVFPANANIGAADADVNEASFDVANENGNYFSNMNHAMRLLGIPSVSVSMGIMEDTRMPVNLTLIGPAYSDNDLLRYAYAYEHATHNRTAPTRVPALADETVDIAGSSYEPAGERDETDGPEVSLEATLAEDALEVSGTAQDDSGVAETRIYINGERVLLDGDLESWTATVSTEKYLAENGPYSAENLHVLVLAKDALGNSTATTTAVALPQGVPAQ